MEKINSEAGLRKAILQLETAQASEGVILKQQFHAAYESIKPVNLIKRTLLEVGESADIRDRIVTTGIGLATGYISKKIFEGVKSSPLKKLLGTALMFGVTEVIAKNPGTVKKAGAVIFDLIANLHTTKNKQK